MEFSHKLANCIECDKNINTGGTSPVLNLKISTKVSEKSSETECDNNEMKKCIRKIIL